MRTLISVMIISLMFLIGCNGNVPEDEPVKDEIKVEDVLKKINDPNMNFPVTDISKLDNAKEVKLLESLKNKEFNADDLINIANVRKNQGNYEPALRWLGLKIRDNEKYIEIRYRRAQIYYLMGSLKEAYILCKIQVLPDEVTPEYRKLFSELKSQIEAELKRKKKVSKGE